MKKVELTPRAIVGYMVNKCKLGSSNVSRAMGRGRTFASDYMTKGRMPSIPLLIEFATVCGYEVHLIGHGEDITVSLEDE